MFVLYWAKILGERLQDHWSSGSILHSSCSIALHSLVNKDYGLDCLCRNYCMVHRLCLHFICIRFKASITYIVVCFCFLLFF